MGAPRSRVLAGVMAAVLAMVCAAAWLLRDRAGPAGPRALSEPAAGGTKTAELSVARAETAAIECYVKRGGRAAAASVAVRPAGEETDFEVPSEDPPLATAEAGAGGTAAFDGLPLGRYEVRAFAPDGAAGIARVRLDVPGVRGEAVVELPHFTSVLSGRAVHAGGEPFHGFVSASYRPSERFFPQETVPVRTGQDGRFTLTGMRPGPVLLVATVPGESQFEAGPFTVPAHGETLLVVDAGDEAFSRYRLYRGETLFVREGERITLEPMAEGIPPWIPRSGIRGLFRAQFRRGPDDKPARPCDSSPPSSCCSRRKSRSRRSPWRPPRRSRRRSTARPGASRCASPSRPRRPSRATTS